MANNPFQIVIIGAGYAGLLATTRLAARVRREMRGGRVAVTLVNEAEVFVERLRLHQQAANLPIASRPIRETLRGTGVEFVHGRVMGIDPANHNITVQSAGGARRVGYHHLLYALGSTIERDSVPGVAEHAYVLMPRGPRAVPALRQRLLELSAAGGGRVLVVGGGATGIEAAAEFADSCPAFAVTLATAENFGAFTTAPVANYMRRSLQRLGVTVRDRTAIAEVRPGEARTAGGAALPFDALLWAGGFTVPGLARESGLAVNDLGQVLIGPLMRSASHPDISAAGDAAWPVEQPGAPVRMSAMTAAFMGAHAADNLAALVQGRALRPLSFSYYGQGIALGRRDAIGFNNYPDDIPNPPYVVGKLGFEFRDLFVRLLAALPRIEKRVPGAFLWLGKGRYAAAKRRARRSSRAVLRPGSRENGPNWV